MTAIKHEAEVLHNIEIAKDVFRLTLKSPLVAKSAKAGQFVMVRAGGDSFTPLLRRPFSIHQVNDNGHIQILFKIVGSGTVFLSNCNVGDRVSIVGPLGRGFRDPVKPENICLIGGGMGIAPLFYLTKQFLDNGVQARSISVLLGAATSSEIMVFNDEFAASGVDVSIATDDGSFGHHGLVTELLSEKLEQNYIWNIFSCGPNPMMKAVAGFCAERDWPCQVSLETLMACGVEACLGCAIRASNNSGVGKKYLHVCKDGPVFEAGEVAW